MADNDAGQSGRNDRPNNYFIISFLNLLGNKFGAGWFVNKSRQVNGNRNGRHSQRHSILKLRLRDVILRGVIVLLIFFDASDIPIVFLLPEKEGVFSVLRGEVRYKLRDGTMVSVPMGSMLLYSEQNSGREAVLTGLVSLKLSANPFLPLIVRGNSLGTKLTVVMDFQTGHDESHDITIEETKQGGLVVTDESGVTHQASAGKEAVYNPETGEFYEMFEFKGVTLEDAAKKLEEEFHVAITVSKRIRDCHVQGVFRKGDINKVLKVLTILMPRVKYKSVVDENGKLQRIEISGRGCEDEPTLRRTAR